MGLIGFHLYHVFAGISQILAPTVLFLLFPLKWLEIASSHRVTYIASPNSGLKHFMDTFKGADHRPENMDLSCIKLICNGAEPISYGTAKQFLDCLEPFALGRNTMYTVYGMAEASLAVCFPTPGETIGRLWLDRHSLGPGNPVSDVDEGNMNAACFVDLGYPLPNVSIRISGENGENLPEECVGHIQIRGDNVTKGYFGSKDTAESAFTQDGWLRTGDLGFLRNGRLIVTGREKDIIFSGGLNYYSHDIENSIIGSIGRNIQVAAVGVFNHRSGEDELVVFIADKTMDYKATASLAVEIHQCVRTLLGIPVTHVIPIKRLPKTTSGKIQRSRLRGEYLRGEYSDSARRLSECIEKELSLKKTPVRGASPGGINPIQRWDG
jgi:acyl-CoA synthetase (AMP-forming)/AMP-acid ligase II